MRYQVPQFIDVEDKIVGPLTLKQFVYLAGGAGMCFVIYTYVPLLVAIPLILIVAGLSTSLAFYKINNKPFIDFVESAFMFYTKQNLYIWKKEQKKVVKKDEIEKDPNKVFVPRLSESKLKEMSWSLDVNENLNPLTSKSGVNTK
jgi:hypothetical protein